MVHNKMHKDRLNEKANSEGKKKSDTRASKPKKNPSNKMRRTLKHAQNLGPTFLDDIIHLIIQRS